MFVGLCEGKHHKSVPQFSEIPARVGNMIIRLIAINSGYTSRVLVRTTHPQRIPFLTRRLPCFLCFRLYTLR